MKHLKLMRIGHNKWEHVLIYFHLLFPGAFSFLFDTQCSTPDTIVKSSSLRCFVKLSLHCMGGRILREYKCWQQHMAQAVTVDITLLVAHCQPNSTNPLHSECEKYGLGRYVVLVLLRCVLAIKRGVAYKSPSPLSTSRYWLCHWWAWNFCTYKTLADRQVYAKGSFCTRHLSAI